MGDRPPYNPCKICGHLSDLNKNLCESCRIDEDNNWLERKTSEVDE